jgi:uncharacterized protein YyaL (SSP411 family)
MNRLAGATSPYLRQHAGNPVDWWPWSGEAFAEAKRRNVPVHLSIGYAACHWCHVMAGESFSDPATAEALNRDFVSIKVDREERPDVDQVYMRALHALGEQGGWPLTMFLTPEAEPFWGGTYFPPEPRWGRPSFRQILAAVSATWKSGDAAIAQNAAALRAHLQQENSPAAGPAAEVGAIDRAATTLLSAWDLAGGSFRGAPKFPNPVVLDTLWRSWLRTDDERFRTAVLATLTSLCQGGIYDHLAGGFARYAVDAGWKVPHFEKMLYDNGLILSALSYAFRDTASPLFRIRIVETVGWLTREMQMPSGAFASSLDADTEHEEGLTSIWSWSELSEILGPDLQDFAAIYDASPDGNWEGRIVLNRMQPAAREWLGDAREATLAHLRSRLLARRAKRPQPARDDKILADWNGLAIAGLAHAAQATGLQEAANAAVSAFRCVRDTMTEGDRLAHSFMEGERMFPGVATDYANMISAALSLFAMTGDADYLSQASQWFAAADRHHFDVPTSAYRLSADDAEPLFATPMSAADEATPAATGRMAANAVTLFMLTGEPGYRARADDLFRPLAHRAARDVVGSASLQSAYDNLLRARSAFVVGTEDAVAPLNDAALQEPDPALVLAAVDPATIGPANPAAGKRPRGDAALFLCDAFRCLPEVADANEAAALLRSTRRGLA